MDRQLEDKSISKTTKCVIHAEPVLACRGSRESFLKIDPGHPHARTGAGMTELAIRCFLSSGLICMFFIAFMFSFAYAYDLDPHYKFSGVKGPDSPFKNTTGAFQTDLFSGSFGYQYKIDVPPGTNGLTPDLSISYNSHSAKGKAGWVGAGWEIPLSYIQRNI